MNKLDIPTIEFIIEQVTHFDAMAIIDGKNETEEDKLINMYADGTVQGYKDAVKQILDFLKDLKEGEKLMTW